MDKSVNLESVWSHLKSQNVSEVESQPVEKYGWLSVFCSFLQPPSSTLPSQLLDEKQSLIQLSKSSFNHDDEIHRLMLFTLFNKLTGLNSPNPIGTHWEIIGFQGIDPATDFRAVGMFGLLQPFASSLSEDTLPFIVNVVNLSHSPSQGFPFMVLSLNVSNMVLKALKDGLLDRVIKQKAAALRAVNLCYAAILYFIYDNWKKEKLTLNDCGQLLKKAESLCKKELSLCISRFESHIEELRNIHPPTAVQLEQVQFQLIEKDTPSIPPM